MTCRSTKCENYEAMKSHDGIDGDGWCTRCKRFYPDQFREKEIEK